MISEIPRQKLCEIVAKYGRSISDEPRKCEGILRDLCGSHRREIAALVNALKSRTPEELINASVGVPQEILVGRLAKKLEDHLGVDRELARWAVTTWGMALGRFAVDVDVQSIAEQARQVENDRERLRLAEEQESKRKAEEFDKRVEDERKRLEQEAKRNAEERLRLQEEQQRFQAQKSMPSPAPAVDTRKRRQRLIGGVAVAAVLTLGGGGIAWQKWQAAETARLEAIRQAEIAKRQAEEQRRLAEIRLQQEQQRQVALRQQDDLTRQQLQRELREQQQRELALRQQSQTPSRQLNPWDQQPRPASLDRQRQAQYEQQRQFQEEQQRRQQEAQQRAGQQQAQRRQAQYEQQRQFQEEQQRRQQEAQQRSGQEQVQRLIEEGIRNLGRQRR